MPDHFYEVDPSKPFVGPAWVDKIARWIKGHPRQLLLAGVVLQLLVLSSMIVLHAAPLVFGDRILLRVHPVDPRDIFRGDFVVLSYDFSRVPPGGIAGLPDPPDWRGGSRQSDSWLEDRTVFASLEPEPDGNHYRAGAISVHRPRAGRYLKGKFSRAGFGNDLHFGIEDYYVQEGQGQELEDLRNTNQLSAEIALTSWGQATLCGLISAKTTPAASAGK